MGFPKCEVPTRKQWGEMRDGVGGKDGLSKKSMGKALDAFFTAVAKAEKTDDFDAAELAVDALTEVATAYMNDVKKLDKYPKVVDKVRLGVIETAKSFKSALGRQKLAGIQVHVDKANEIGQDWARQAAKFQGLLEAQKKGELADVKAALDRQEEMIAKGDHLEPRVLQDMQGDLVGIRKSLDGVRKFCTETYGQFNTWALGDPRSNFGFIAKKLGLGDATSGLYRSVVLECKAVLTEVAEAVNGVEALWMRDISFQLDRQQGRLESLEKVLNGEISASAGLARRLSDEVQRFVQDCDKLFKELKVQSDSTWLPKAQLGELDPNKAQTWSGHVVLFQKKQAALPKLLELVEKNRQRVLKSVPNERLRAFEQSPVGKQMSEAAEQVRLRLKQAGTLYTKLLEAYAQQGYKG